MFTLGRPDMLPVDDLGVRKGAEKMYQAAASRRKNSLAFGERWAPHRSAAAWHLWRIADTLTPDRSPVEEGKEEAAKKRKPAPKKVVKAVESEEGKEEGAMTPQRRSFQPANGASTSSAFATRTKCGQDAGGPLRAILSCMPAVARIDPKTVFTPEEWDAAGARGRPGAG